MARNGTILSNHTTEKETKITKTLLYKFDLLQILNCSIPSYLSGA